jgi:hypothetical protein
VKQIFKSKWFVCIFIILDAHQYSHRSSTILA